MFKRNLASVPLSAFMLRSRTTVTPSIELNGECGPRGVDKGQKRQARQKPSGAAQAKRAATKRKNSK